MTAHTFKDWKWADSKRPLRFSKQKKHFSFGMTGLFPVDLETWPALLALVRSEVDLNLIIY
jgi:hypothetical protein